MNLHLGSGNKYLPGWINVDLYAEKADIRADLRTVTFPEFSADRIRLIHVIEHFTHMDGVDLLRRCAAWLKSEGTLEIETPDRQKCLRAIHDGSGFMGAKGLLGGRSQRKPEWESFIHQWAATAAAKVDSQTYEVPSEWDIPGETHLCLWTGVELAAVLRGFGLVPQVQQPLHHAKRSWRDTRIVGIKP